MLSYLYIIKTKLLVALAYRFEIFTIIIAQLLLLFASVYFWISAYGDQGLVADTSLNQMIDYSILSLLLTVMYSISVEDNIKGSIRQGNVAVDFIKPISLMGMYFSTDIAGIIANIFTKFIPVFIIASLCFSTPVPVSIWALLLFIVGVIMGFLIQWLISAIFGLFYFWVIELGPIGSIKAYIITLLSGTLIPLWFLPEWLSEGIKFLPFIYIVQAPISIYIGKITLNEALFGILIQAIWIIILYFCMILLKNKAFKNIVVQGG